MRPSYKPIKNAGKYNRRINIVVKTMGKDADGFPTVEQTVRYPFWASVKTTKGMTLIKNDSDFEKALTNFTIRYPRNLEITRDMLIEFRGKTYTIEYINNVDEANVDLELQAKEVTH